MNETTVKAGTPAASDDAVQKPHSALFSPIAIRGLTLRNRVVASPMCQYSADDGCATDWHVVHVGTLARSGAALVMMEATGVDPVGRITPNCLGLYSDANEAAIARVLKTVRSVSDTPIGIQLGHAGRKASFALPWVGRMPLKPDQGGWQTVAPSPLPAVDGGPLPKELDEAGMQGVVDAFRRSAIRAARLGFDVLEVHSAHGYLLSTFLSPLSNRRTDGYGGSIEGRMRFPLEVVRAVREVWPDDRPFAVKFNGTDWAEGGVSPEDVVAYGAALKDIGVDIAIVSGGGVVEQMNIPLGPGYQLPMTEKVRKETGILTGGVGLITSPRQAEDIIAGGKADFVYLARAILFDARWAYHAATALGVEVPYPPQYDRASPPNWRPGRDFFRAWADA